MRIDAYLIFSGRCAEALALYQQPAQAKTVMLMRFKESPEPPHACALANSV